MTKLGGVKKFKLKFMFENNVWFLKIKKMCGGIKIGVEKSQDLCLQ